MSLCRIHFEVLSHLSLKLVENKINLDRIQITVDSGINIIFGIIDVLGKLKNGGFNF